MQRCGDDAASTYLKTCANFTTVCISYATAVHMYACSNRKVAIRPMW